MDDKIYLGLKHRDYNYMWTFDAEIINHFSIDGKDGAPTSEKMCIHRWKHSHIGKIHFSIDGKKKLISLFVSHTSKIYFSIDGNFSIHFPHR